MKKCVIISSVVIFLISVACNTKKSDSQEPNNLQEVVLYLGQEVPELIAKPYEKEIVEENDWILEGVSSNMNEVYLASTREEPFIARVVVLKRDENKHNVWNKYSFYPATGGNDSILYCRNKYIERTDTGWSTIKSLGSIFEREDWGIMRLSVSDKGTYIFDDYKNNDVIRISTIENGERKAPELLGKEINTGEFTCHPFIAPDDSYIIWDSEREEGHGETDLYISFRQVDGSWGRAINMGENINTEDVESSAAITADGKYLFFWREKEIEKDDGSIHWEDGQRYWVSTKVIAQLRSQQ